MEGSLSNGVIFEGLTILLRKLGALRYILELVIDAHEKRAYINTALMMTEEGIEKVWKFNLMCIFRNL